MNDRRRRVAISRWILLAIGLAIGLAAVVPRTGHAACTPNLQCMPHVMITGGPVSAPAPTTPGTGLCGAFKIAGSMSSFTPQPSDFPSNANLYPTSVNTFLDNPPNTGDGMRYDETLTTVFDLTNNFDQVDMQAVGDFVENAPQTCPVPAGCPFPGSESAVNYSADFATRFRGFLNVKPNWVGSFMYFGVVSDLGVGISLWSKDSMGNLNQTLVMSQGQDPNGPEYRVSNLVQFTQAGLYPIEIVHTHHQAAAILEFAIMIASDPNSYQPVDEATSAEVGKLSTEGFHVDEYTTPDNFFQTVRGAPSFSGAPAQCQQCPRSFAGQPATNAQTGCNPGYFCNQAALCEECDYKDDPTLCGPQCIHCMLPTPICLRPDANNPMNSNCVQCVMDTDCQKNFGTGYKCVNNSCIRPPVACCSSLHPVLAAGHTMDQADYRCFVTGCSACLVDSDCPNGQICDLTNTRCVDPASVNPNCGTDTNCGANCDLNCPQQFPNMPHCLNGDHCAACRIDTDCGPGTYCNSGTCSACVDDRHCGPGCGTCGIQVGDPPDCMPTITNTPKCFAPDNAAKTATCVQCTQDSDCGDGATCANNTCQFPMPMTCMSGQVQRGNACVACNGSSQCTCGICDPSSGTCIGGCNDNSDCQGDQCCTLDSSSGMRTCQSGSCGGTAGGALCGCSVAQLAAAPLKNVKLDPMTGLEVASTRGGQAALLAMLLFALGMRRRLGKGKMG